MSWHWPNWSEIEFSGFAPSTIGAWLLQGGLAACSLLVIVQLLSLYWMRAGEQKTLHRSLLLSLLIHVCLFLGWTSALPSQMALSDTQIPGGQRDEEDKTTLQFREATEIPHESGGIPSVLEPDATPARRERSQVQPREAPDREPLPTRDQVRPRDVARLEPVTSFSDESPAPRMSQAEPQVPSVAKAAPVPIDTLDNDSPRARPEPQNSGARTYNRLRSRPDVTDQSRLPTISPATEQPATTGTAMELLREATAPAPAKGSVELSAPMPFVPRKADTGGTMRRLPSQAAIDDRGVQAQLYGTVRDSQSGLALAGAAIRFDRKASPPIEVTTNDQGVYQMQIGEIPDTFVITVTRSGYVAAARSLRARDVVGKGSRIDFALNPTAANIIQVESQPKVHHLGNDQFEGKANSQFQRPTEGKTFEAKFSISKLPQTRGRTPAVLSLMMKGVQCPAAVSINGVLLPRNTDLSPADGEYATMRLPFEATQLRAGENAIKIMATECQGDLDDFEFVNLQIRLPDPD